MPEKLLTLRELSLQLEVSEEKIVSLVDEGVITAYQIGGEFLRFRKDQIEAIRSEINTRITEKDRITSDEARTLLKERQRDISGKGPSFVDKVRDFFYFYDFYIVSSLIIIFLLLIIFQG